MNLTSPSQVKAWCIENGFHPNRVLGQNFLIDRNALEAIVDAGLAGVKTPAGASVLEIGPGLGVLTEEILKRGCSVTAVEKDPVLAARLAESLGNPPNLSVVEADALDWISRSPFPVPRSPFDAMVSNLPYQAGTRILLELVQRHDIPSMTVLVQTEVAERLAAKEGSKTRGLAGVWAQLDYDVKIVRKVAASCFWPRPEIGSSVVTLTRHDRNVALSAKERGVFHRLTKKAFEHRRKQLGSIFKDLIQSSLRAEELTNEEWINLSKGIAENEDA
ncbi:MAG: ribosomal RNA small subunit methyltransferase A [Kiritimatiellae bacterium]|nr:ribosomal RNA small subunit methyltransferase A [Kiritimatiellia bacterium]